MTLSELTFCSWDGDADERFTYRDMNRITYNVNAIARETGVSEVQFITADQSQQFRYDEVQKVENLTRLIALQTGASITAIRTWQPGSILTFADFERIESNLFACYQRIGGIGQRIPAGRFRPIVSATLFPESWTGSPWHIDIDVPMVHDDAEVVAYVPHTATMEQRIAEMEGRLVASVVSDRIVRITATGARPKVSLPIKIALEGLTTIENKTLSTTWSGSGPWTQTVTLAQTPENVLVGMQEGMTSAQTKAYADAGIFASAISGTTVTITAAFEKPTVQIPIGIYYSTSSVV